MDEASLSLLPSVHRTYSKKASTPVLKNRSKYSQLSIASAISEKGRIFYEVRQCNFKGNAIVRFLRNLLKGLRKKITIIWDGATCHICGEVKAFLKTPQGQNVWLEKLPAYAPELNADEQVWNYLKNVQLKNTCCKNAKELKSVAILKLEEMKNNPKLIKKFFKHPEVAFV